LIAGLLRSCHKHAIKNERRRASRLPAFPYADLRDHRHVSAGIPWNVFLLVRFLEVAFAAPKEAESADFRVSI
jgi:hypothetical protein